MSGNRILRSLRQYWPYMVILGLSAFLRFFKLSDPMSFIGIDYPFAVNGADEGIHLMAAKLGASGYQMYVQVNAQQGPLFMFIYGLLDGTPIYARIMSVLFSLAGLLGMIFIAEKISNRTVGILATLFLSFNFFYFKESRIASVDLYSTVFLIWAFYFMIRYYMHVEDARHKRRELTLLDSSDIVAAGTLFSFAAMSKLFAVIPLIGLGIYMSIRWLRSLKLFRHMSTRLFCDMIVMVVATLVPTILIMSIFGIEETFTGIVLDNLHRPSQDIMVRFAQLSAFALVMFVPLAFSIVAMFRYFRDRTVQLIMVWVLTLSVWFLFQSLTWLHHLTLLAPPICLLGAIGIYHLLVQPVGRRIKKDKTVSLKDFFEALTWEVGMRSLVTDSDHTGPGVADRTDVTAKNVTGSVGGSQGQIISPSPSRRDISKAIWRDTTARKRKLFIVALVLFFLLVTTGSNFAFVLYADTPLEYIVGKDVKSLTNEGDFVISGNPIVTLYADREQPPEATNLAIVRYPPINPFDLINYTLDYNVRVVVLTYNLSGWIGYVDFIRMYFEFYKGYDRLGHTSHIEGEIPIAMETFNVFLRPVSLNLTRAREEYMATFP